MANDSPTSANTLHVRQASLADLEALVPLFNAHLEFHGKQADLEGAWQFLRERFERAESAVFIAWLGSVPAGFAQLYPSFSSTAMARVLILNDLYVRGAARRHGVASALLEAVEAFAWKAGAVRLSLIVLRTNVRGQALYAARGWQQDEEFFAYHRYSPAPPG